jgi:hypothetical protein
VVQVFEQHLPLVAAGIVELPSQGQFQPGQVQHEGDGFADLACGGVLEEQLQLGRIGGDDAKPNPLNLSQQTPDISSILR